MSVSGRRLAVFAVACTHSIALAQAGGSKGPAGAAVLHSGPGPAENAALGAQAEQRAEPPDGVEASLADVLAYADRRSPVLLVARSTRSRADAARVAASVLLPTNPELSAALGPRSSAAGTGLDLEVSLMQQLEIAGERGVRIDAAERQRELTDAEVEKLRWTVHCEVHAAFHRALIEQERSRLAERVVAFQREVLRVVERQISAGETAPLLLRLAQAEVAQAEQVLVAARQSFLASRLLLAKLAGWPIASPPTPSGVVDHPQDPPAIDRLVAMAREHLPNLRAAKARVRAAQADVSVADRQAWIRPSLGLQYRHESNPGERTYNILLGALSLPIPSFQTNQGERARTRAELSVAQAELSASSTLLEAEIAAAQTEVAAAAQRARAYAAEILPRFEENLTLLRRSFELGEIDLLALSTGRERFLRIQSDALGAQQDYFVALAGLERVVGMDLWRDVHERDVHERDVHERDVHDKENAP